MRSDPSTLREQLLAELFSDIQEALNRLERVDKSVQATTKALADGTASYQQAINDQVNRFRAETKSMLLTTTEHAAKSLVGQQRDTLEKAATLAIQRTLTADVLKRTRHDSFMTAAVGALTGTAATLVLIILDHWLTS